MVVFKCKMCGGTLDVAEGVSVVECEYCGTTQTLPTSHDEVIVNLFNRANNLRLKSEYDKAAEVYDKILDLDNTLAEAHWGVVLCKYGVEYVEDSLMDERIPTCHRTQMESILTDISYQSVLQYADPAAKALYEAQAQEINELQKSILQIVKSEKPFDVFICYKETDFSGERTKDSVIANEIYHELTNSGLKVFFAAITLEDKLGQEYEPYIFAALTSAKVMIVLGTKQEYFNAVWVKNEWSRYLHLMKSDRQTKRTLIPCFRDMDAYDLPNEFSHLQALDMASIAFMPDLTRNIKKLVGTSVDSSTEKEKIFAQTTEFQVTPLLKRAFITLGDGDFTLSDELLEKVLNLDPENAKAYVGKLMCELRINQAETLSHVGMLYQYANFSKALQFADDEYRITLLDYVYQAAIHLMNQKKYTDAIHAFRYLADYDYRDSAEKVTECETAAKEREYLYGLTLMQTGSYDEAIPIFKRILDYKDAEEKVSECELAILERKYQQGRSLMQDGAYGSAIDTFRALSGYKDADSKVNECRGADLERTYQSALQYAKNRQYEEAITQFSSIRGYKNSEENIKRCQKEIKSRERNGNVKDYAICLGIGLIGGGITYVVEYFLFGLIGVILAILTGILSGRTVTDVGSFVDEFIGSPVVSTIRLVIAAMVGVGITIYFLWSKWETE